MYTRFSFRGMCALLLLQNGQSALLRRRGWCHPPWPRRRSILRIGAAAQRRQEGTGVPRAGWRAGTRRSAPRSSLGARPRRCSGACSAGTPPGAPRAPSSPSSTPPPSATSAPPSHSSARPSSVSKRIPIFPLAAGASLRARCSTECQPRYLVLSPSQVSDWMLCLRQFLFCRRGWVGC